VVTAQRWVPVVFVERVHLFPVDGTKESYKQATVPLDCAMSIVV
jgi:hypothetical protein